MREGNHGPRNWSPTLPHVELVPGEGYGHCIHQRLCGPYGATSLSQRTGPHLLAEGQTTKEFRRAQIPISLKKRVKALSLSDIPEWTLQVTGHMPNHPGLWGPRVLGAGTYEAANLSEKPQPPFVPVLTLPWLFPRLCVCPAGNYMGFGVSTCSEALLVRVLRKRGS